MLVLAGLLFIFLGYRTRKKEDKRLWYVIGAAALAGFAITGGYITFASAPSAKTENQVPSGLWKATIASCGDASSNVGTWVLAPDGSHCDVYITRATYSKPNPTLWNITVNVFNENTNTQNTQPYPVQLSYGSVASVQAIASGASYPLLGLLSDGKTYNVVWSAVSSAPTPTVISPGVYQASFTSLQNGQEKAVLTLNGGTTTTATFTSMTVGQVYEVDLTVGGVTLPIFVHPTA